MRRCNVQHEQVHLDLGHDGCQDEREEARVRRIAAQKLIGLPPLIEAARWAMSIQKLADELWVTPEVLLDRIRYLHPHERLIVCGALQKAWEHHGA